MQTPECQKERELLAGIVRNCEPADAVEASYALHSDSAPKEKDDDSFHPDALAHDLRGGAPADITGATLE
jgi:hypothetical protein